MSSTLGYPLRFVELAQEINNSMPSYVVRRVQRLLNEDGQAVRGARVLLVGVTYKPDIADQRETPARGVARDLRTLGAELAYHDPHVARFELEDGPLPSASLEDGYWDVAVVLQHHADVDLSSVSNYARRILDTRGSLDRAVAEYL